MAVTLMPAAIPILKAIPSFSASVSVGIGTGSLPAGRQSAVAAGHPLPAATNTAVDVTP